MIAAEGLTIIIGYLPTSRLDVLLLPAHLSRSCAEVAGEPCAYITSSHGVVVSSCWRGRLHTSCGFLPPVASDDIAIGILTVSITSWTVYSWCLQLVCPLSLLQPPLDFWMMTHQLHYRQFSFNPIQLSLTLTTPLHQSTRSSLRHSKETLTLPWCSLGCTLHPQQTLSKLLHATAKACIVRKTG